MITEDQIKIAIAKFQEFNNQVNQKFSTFPVDTPANYKFQKRTELVALLRVLNHLDIKDYYFEKCDSEKPDFLLDITGESFGVEVLDYFPDEKAVENRCHWEKLCDKLTEDFLLTKGGEPMFFEITIKDLAYRGCTYEDFKNDFILYQMEGSNLNTRYIANIQYHCDIRTFAYIKKRPYALKDIDMKHLTAYIRRKKDNKVPEYQKNASSTNIWLIVNIEITSEIDIENAPLNYMTESPFSKIFLAKGETVKQIYSK